MWGPLAAELGIPWRAAEAMHWQLGETEMARRAGVVPFTLASSSSTSNAPVSTSQAPPPGSFYLPQGSPETHSTRPSRSSSLGQRSDDLGYIPRPPMSGGQPPFQPVAGALLPSLAELERGAYDERARLPEPHLAHYHSGNGGGPGYERR